MWLNMLRWGDYSDYPSKPKKKKARKSESEEMRGDILSITAAYYAQVLAKELGVEADSAF